MSGASKSDIDSSGYYNNSHRKKKNTTRSRTYSPLYIFIQIIGEPNYAILSVVFTSSVTDSKIKWLLMPPI